MTEELDPKTFDIDAWLEDAHLPEDCQRVYKRGDLIAKLTALQEKLKDLAENDGGTLAGSVEMQKTREEYERVEAEFTASALDIYVRAVPSSKVRELQKVYGSHRGKPTGGHKDELQRMRENALIDLNYAIIAEAIVAVAPADGERSEVDWSIDQVKALENRIGSGQYLDITQTKNALEAGVKEPDADFLHKLFGGNSDDSEG